MSNTGSPAAADETGAAVAAEADTTGRDDPETTGGATEGGEAH
jgi:hypothetical protein